MKPLFTSVRDFFMVLLMTFAMLRRSEVVALLRDDVWLDNVNGRVVLFVLVQKSKVDQLRVGHTIMLGANAKDPDLCVATWFRLYLGLRHESKFFFHSAFKGHPGLSRSTPNRTLKRMLATIKVDAALFGSHSCRRGGATAAMAGGVAAHVVMRHGNWLSNAFYKYVVDPLEVSLSVGVAIAASTLVDMGSVLVS